MTTHPRVRPVTDVGFIGLGDQGAPMARAVARAGWRLHVWARRPASLEAIMDLPHVVHDTIPELARACDLVSVCVRDDNDVAEVLVSAGLLEALSAGAIVANHGTGSPDKCPALEERGRLSGVSVLDAPVSGGATAARDGTLTVMVGGNRAAFERARPVFAAFAQVVEHVGSAGAGQMAKLLNNALFAANLKSIGDVLDVADQLDLDVPRLVSLLKASSGASYALHALAAQASEEEADHARRLISKDVDLFVEASRRRGIASPDLERSARDGAEGIPMSARRLRTTPCP